MTHLWSLRGAPQTCQSKLSRRRPATVHIAGEHANDFNLCRHRAQVAELGSGRPSAGRQALAVAEGLWDFAVVIAGPSRVRRGQAHHMLEYFDGVIQVHRAAAVEVGSNRLVRRQGRVARVDLESDDHLEDRNCVDQPHRRIQMGVVDRDVGVFPIADS